ncbi:LapA family protein [Streptomyces sp. ISL-98]|uniref:lipopolysaccharide assembly protein LapA domain-containing protein n=1 Tax=Streptomyces sp. ISL-98 TaxID=2819192 RepID=UPI001BE8966E|nr:LapA family protein [Streptomyces sp. ISL-98]MBT2508942.1 LapA family protein [Streptomyces sp. ISL-98]
MSPKDGPGGDWRRADGRITPARVAIILIVILTLVFIFENTRQVKVRLLIPEVTMPLYLALLAMAVIGALCGGYFIKRRK